MAEVLLETNLEGVPLFGRGKVRDVYDLGNVGHGYLDYGPALLIVATDRISAHDVVMPNGIPGKGEVLTKMSLFWFDFLSGIIANHYCSYQVTMPYKLKGYDHALDCRSMVVKKTAPFKVECVVRGYITGSGWRDYQKTGAICGNYLPVGLIESQKLPHPIFTPATKADTGHDVNITFKQAVEILGDQKIAEELRYLSLQLYTEAHD